MNRRLQERLQECGRKRSVVAYDSKGLGEEGSGRGSRDGKAVVRVLGVEVQEWEEPKAWRAEHVVLMGAPGLRSLWQTHHA